MTKIQDFNINLLTMANYELGHAKNINGDKLVKFCLDYNDSKKITYWNNESKYSLTLVHLTIFSIWDQISIFLFSLSYQHIS